MPARTRMQEHQPRQRAKPTRRCLPFTGRAWMMCSPGWHFIGEGPADMFPANEQRRQPHGHRTHYLWCRSAGGEGPGSPSGVRVQYRSQRGAAFCIRGTRKDIVAGPGLLRRRKRTKSTAASLIRSAGFNPLDMGPLSTARYIEPFSLLVAQLAYDGSNGPELAYHFELFRKHARYLFRFPRAKEF